MSTKSDGGRDAAAGQPKAGVVTMKQPEKAVLPAGKHENFGEDMSSVNTLVVKIKAQAQAQAGPTQPKK